MFDLFITTNGPGEIVTWVTPIVKKLKKDLGDKIRITIFILPCRFATGNEQHIASAIPEVDYIFPADKFRSVLFKLPFSPYKKGVVLFLGGDPFLTLLLKWRYKFSAISYTEGNNGFMRFYDHSFYRDKDGDLMLESFKYHESDKNLINELKNKKNVVFFPGSRPDQFKYLYPMMQDIAVNLPSDVNPVFSISPHISVDFVDKYTKYNSGFLVYRDKSIELMKTAYLAVTIPGTNNVQIAHHNVPALVVFPFNHPEVVNFNGLLGAILNLPGLKKYGKAAVLHLLNKKEKYVTLINRKENKGIYPELRGILSTDIIRTNILTLIEDTGRLNSIRIELQKLSKNTDVLDRICDAVKSDVQD